MVIVQHAQREYIYYKEEHLYIIEYGQYTQGNHDYASVQCIGLPREP